MLKGNSSALPKRALNRFRRHPDTVAGTVSWYKSPGGESFQGLLIPVRDAWIAVARQAGANWHLTNGRSTYSGRVVGRDSVSRRVSFNSRRILRRSRQEVEKEHLPRARKL